MSVPRLYDIEEQEWAVDCNGDKPDGEYLMVYGCNCSPMDGGMCGCCTLEAYHYTDAVNEGMYIMACKRKLKRLGYRVPNQQRREQEDY